MFIKVQIYCNRENCCFDDIMKSQKPELLINTEEIVSLDPTTDWGFCAGHKDYPYRVLNMIGGKSYLCVKESANELERALLKQNGPQSEALLPSESITKLV